MGARVTPAARPAIFLDRDGVLNVDKGYAFKPEDLQLTSGTAAAVAELKRRGYCLIVVSNQSGVARGKFGEQDVTRFNAALDKALRRAGGFGIDAFYYCPHLVDGTVEAYAKDCDCRKPKPGMIQKAARELRIDLSRSFMVGDKPDDIDCAEAAGIRGVQVTASGYPAHPKAVAYVASLSDALPYLR